ncbi:hypothetical protein P775_11145 [Puniceibacterium antarcticum]|uniref:Uncharacterized protein n=1 Tax=Puniceibacterium antarcticum TaxID=1206336 RepID=A0A2G8RF45_9RHOB|nr:hypothetical protein P775_11145 [Puniceibacterium antarcticum]
MFHEDAANPIGMDAIDKRGDYSGNILDEVDGSVGSIAQFVSSHDFVSSCSSGRGHNTPPTGPAGAGFASSVRIS